MDDNQLLCLWLYAFLNRMAAEMGHRVVLTNLPETTLTQFDVHCVRCDEWLVTGAVTADVLTEDIEKLWSQADGHQCRVTPT